MPLYSKQANESAYWNPYLETMPREKLNQIHLRRLKKIMQYAYTNVPMYKDIYDKAGFKVSDINSLQDYLEIVPTIDKTDVVHYQQKKPPFGESVHQNVDEYANLFYMTSGSTGKPMMEIGYFKDIQHQWVYPMWAAGIRPHDVCYFAFNFGTFLAFWSAYFDCLLLGTQVITSGGQDTQSRIRQIVDLQPTVLFATPTYALHIAEVARKMGIDPAKTSVKWVCTAGEPGAAVTSIRNALENAWGAKAVDIYGMSEMWGPPSWQCPEYGDRLHLNELLAYGVVVDEQGKLVPSGGSGELILTNYNATLMPLIKYRTHDVVEWHTDGCECGRSWLWLKGGVLGRTDQMVTIKGTNVYPAGIQSVLGGVAQLSEHLEIHYFRGEKGDEVLVKIEPKLEVTEDQYPSLQQHAAKELNAAIGARIEVRIVVPDTLPRYELKAKRVFDHRQEDGFEMKKEITG